MVIEVLREQVKLEEETGREVWAARPSGQHVGQGNSDAIGSGRSICEKMLGCDKTRLRGLQW